jgi:hypothetical protein
MKKDRHADTLRREYRLTDFKEKGVRGKYAGRILKDGTGQSRRHTLPRVGRKRAVA